MKKGKFIFFILSLFFLFGLTFVSRAEAQPSSDHTFSLPSQAKQITKGVYDLGFAIDNGRTVKGLAILHPRPEVANDHKPNHNPGKGGGGDGTTCYGYIANGARWRVTEPYYLNPENNDGYSEADIVSETASAMQTWENGAAFDIFGANLGAQGVDGADTTSTDGKNEIFFGSFTDPGTIAVTIVWYTVGGPPWSRQIVEHDMIFNDPDFNWGNAGPTSETELGDTSIMDYLAIATHELGHSAGLADLYDSACSEETMYGYGSEGETKARTLNTGDIEGITKLYN